MNTITKIENLERERQNLIRSFEDKKITLEDFTPRNNEILKELSKLDPGISVEDLMNDLDSEKSSKFNINDEELTEEQEEAAVKRYKKVKSLSEMEVVEQNEDEEFKPNFESLTETGQLTKDTYMFYDYNREKYVYFNAKTKEKKVWGVSSAGHKLFEVFQKAGYTTKNPTSDLKFVKKVNVEFDIKKPQFWETGLGVNYNEFEENLTQLGTIDKIRKDFKEEKGKEYKKELFKSGHELKKVAPKIYALLMNLMEEDIEAVTHFINWFASFCNTRDKIATAFMFASLEGSGKGVLTDVVIRYFFGEKYQASIMASRLKKEFNASLENKLLINFNEVSSDFSKADEATQNLKALITDDTFTLNVKKQSEFQAKNNFLIILSQNNLNGVKMSQSDRRFNYFNPQRTLKSVAKDDFGIKRIGTFIEEMKEELDSFVEFIALFDYDKYEAAELYETEGKKRSQLATSGPSEILFNTVKNKDIFSLTDSIEDIVERYHEAEDKNKYSDLYVATCMGIKETLKVIETDFEKDFISSKNLTKLYTILVEDTKTMSDRLIKKIFDSNLTKVKTPKYTEGKTSRNCYDLAAFKSQKEKDQDELDNF